MPKNQEKPMNRTIENTKKKWELLKPKINTIFRVIISYTLIYACIHKIVAPTEFAKLVALYEIVPHNLVVPFSYSLPVLELVCSVLIWVPLTKISANICNAGMMLMFIVAISYALILGKDINCGCFSNNEPVGYTQLLIDASLLLIIIYCLKTDFQQASANQKRSDNAKRHNL